MCLHIYTPYHTSVLLCTHNIIHTYTAIVSITIIVIIRIISQRLLQGTTIIVIITIKMSLLAYIYVCVFYTHMGVSENVVSSIPQNSHLKMENDDSPLEFGSFWIPP